MPENFNLGLSSSDFGKLANEWNPATLDQGGQEAVAAAQQIHQQAVKGLADTGARMGARAQAQNAPTGFEKVVTRQTPEGPVTDAYGITPDQMAFFTKAADFYKQALGGYAQEAQRLEMMQQRAQSQPWQQLATALSANLAQQKDMPGWVQGLGATAAQMNPTVDQLAARKMAVMGQGAGIAEKGMAIGTAQQKLHETETFKQQKELDEIAKRIVSTTRLALKASGGQPLDQATVEGIVSAEDPRGVYPVDKIPGLINFATGAGKAMVAGLDKATQRQKSLVEFTSGLIKDRNTDLANLNHDNRTKEIKQRLDFSISQPKLDYEKELLHLKNQLNIELANDKSLGVVDRQGLSQLGEAAANDMYIGKVQRMLKTATVTEESGPLLGRNPKTGEWTVNMNALLPGAMQPAEFTEYKSQMKHELPRMLKLIMGGGGQGGISIMRTVEGKKMLEELGASKEQRFDQIAGIMNVISDTNNDNKMKVVLQHKNVPWLNNYSELLGVNDPTNSDYFLKNMDKFGNVREGRQSPMQTLAGGSSVSAPPAGAKPTAGLRGQTTPQIETGKDYGPAPSGMREGATGNGGKFVVKNGRWIGA
jgi:hypothetical protein